MTYTSEPNLQRSNRIKGETENLRNELMVKDIIKNIFDEQEGQPLQGLKSASKIKVDKFQKSNFLQHYF